MSNVKCEGCDLYINESCIKYRNCKNGEAILSTNDMFTLVDNDKPHEFIPVERVCRKASIFGNLFVRLTQDDIDRLRNGEIIHIGGEYGTFISFKS